MKVGQPVSVRVDAVPGREFKAHVESLQVGTGSRFTLLPPENATGNFVKVVQRIPVKIVFDEPPADLERLWAGESVEPKVDVRDRSVQSELSRRASAAGDTRAPQTLPRRSFAITVLHFTNSEESSREAQAMSHAITPSGRAVNPWWIGLTLTIATFMELLDTSIANVSLPHIAGGLGTSLTKRPGS